MIYRAALGIVRHVLSLLGLRPKAAAPTATVYVPEDGGGWAPVRADWFAPPEPKGPAASTTPAIPPVAAPPVLPCQQQPKVAVPRPMLNRPRLRGLWPRKE